jgi:hypothetical protein
MKRRYRFNNSSKLFLGIVAIFPVLALAQSPGGPPAPLWPDNGLTPSQLGSQHVFLGRDGDIVVALPSRGDNPPRIIHVPWHNKLSAAVAVSLSVDQDQYRFDYELMNPTASKDAVTIWSLIVPPDKVSFRMSREPWPGARSLEPIGKQIGLDWISPGGFVT